MSDEPPPQAPVTGGSDGSQHPSHVHLTPSSASIVSGAGSDPSSPQKRNILVDAKIPTKTPKTRGNAITWKLEDIRKEIMPSYALKTDSGQVFPQFDDLNELGIAESKQKMMLHDESGRFMAIAQDFSKPLVFTSNSEMLKRPGDKAGYRNLWMLGCQIQNANLICRLQNECINAHHCERMRSSQNLVNLIRSVEGIPKSKGDNFDPEHVAVYDLANYISAVLARLIVQTSPSRYWQLTILGVLIKRITKIKCVLSDMDTFKHLATRDARSILEKMPKALLDSSNQLEEMDEEEECEEYLRQVLASERDGMVPVGDKDIAQHCVNQNRFRIGLNKSLRDIIMSMASYNLSGLEPTAWEICSVAYETGFKGFKTLLYQDRDLEYSATSDLDTMNTAHTAFSVLYQIVSCCAARHLTCPATNFQSLKTRIEWVYRGDELAGPRNTQRIDLSGKAESLELTSLSDIIAVLIPLATTAPSFLHNFTKYRHVIALTGSIRSDAAPTNEGKFVAFFRMHTSEFEEHQKGMEPGHGLSLLSKALEGERFSRIKLRESPQPTVPSMPWLPFPKEKTSNSLEKMDQCVRDMDKWIIDETSVTISCGAYVWPVVALATTLALGGLAIGFSVGERILGVDPSNLATYLWVLGAFVVLVAKSIKVGEWSWNDFLLRRVRCKSVSEIQSITGIRPQLIMAKLLHDDCGAAPVLQTRGPYNSVFRNRQGEGFSIDVPITLSTLNLSGLTMLKVVTAKGHALVCLDSRRKTELCVIGHHPQAEMTYLICDDIEQAAPEDEGVDKLRLTRLTGVKWKRIVGIYGPDGKTQFV